MKVTMSGLSFAKNFFRNIVYSAQLTPEPKANRLPSIVPRGRLDKFKIFLSNITKNNPTKAKTKAKK